MCEDGHGLSGRPLVRIGLIVAGLLLFSSLNAAAVASLGLAWDPSTNANVVNYKVYYGVATGAYTNSIEAGPNTAVTISGLADGTRYYFAATAQDSLGQESDYSVETNFVTTPAIGGRPPSNSLPVISGIAGRFIAQDTSTGPIPFTVSDVETPAASLVVTASSSAQGVVPNANIVLSGSGGSRTVTVTPASGATGAATITLSVSDGTTNARTSFLVSVQTTVYTPAAAAYNGLFYESTDVALPSAGSFKLATTKKSSYSGQLTVQGKKYSIKGQLDALGRGTNSIVRKGDSPLTLSFNCGTSNFAGIVFGTLSSTGWLAALQGDRVLFNAKTNPAPWAGSYTLVLPGQSGGPEGHSYGTVKITTAGAVKFAGALSDGTKISQAATLSKDGLWPFYTSLYSGQGLVMSWLGVTGTAATNAPDVEGPASWIKSPNAKSIYYPEGFTNQCNASGAVFVKPASSQHIVHLDKAKVFFSGGDLAGSITNVVEIGANSKVPVTNSMSLTFSITSGSFTGKILDPVSGKNKSFGGVVLQKFSSGYGSLLGTNLSSQVELTP